MTPKLENIRKQAELARQMLDAYPKLDNFPSFAYWKNARNKWEAQLGNESYLEALIQAAELLEGVVVLEEGAKVLPYDIVCEDCNEPRVQFVGSDHHEHRGHYISAEAIMRINKDPDEIPYKIIQRKGKPVITIPKDTK